jgi:hypothetical protein
MKPKRFHLAQANVARMRGPLDSAVMEGFRSQLDRINAVADSSPGFVWRLQTDEGNATAIRAYEVWESLEALHHYVYRSDHAGPLRNRREWFEPLGAPILVRWWVPAGHIPSVEEAKARFAILKARGPTAEAFTFREPFPPPGRAGRVAPPDIDAEFCEWAN